MDASAKIIAFLQVNDRAAARGFFVDQLGLLYVSEDPHALELESNGTRIRISENKDHVPARGTALGWEVVNIVEAVAGLQTKGIEFEKFGFPGQDERGIWTAPSGDKVAWFKDPSGNIISVSQHLK